MGITIHYKFYCKDKKCAENIIKETHRVATAIKTQAPELKIEKHTPTEILINPFPNSEWVHLNFEPYETKMDRQKEKGWDYEAQCLSETRLVDTMGRRYKDWSNIPMGTPVKDEIVGPLFGKGGYQTASFTKTQYGGVEAHLIVCKLLDPAKKMADKEEVSDEADFCGDGDKEDEAKLFDNMESSLEFIMRVHKQLTEVFPGQIGGAAESEKRRIESGK